MNVITVEQLRKARACSVGLGTFVELFGDWVEVTEEVAEENADEFDFDWAVDALLKGAAREKCDSETDVVRKDYHKVYSDARSRWRKGLINYKEFLGIYNEAHNTLDVVVARAFARAYLSQEEE